MAHTQEEVDASQIWFLDSGCSNHMTGFKYLFKELDETYKLKGKLGDDKLIQVEGKGTVFVQTNQNGMKYLHNISFILELSQNLLSVEQLMESGYSIVFEGNFYAIGDKNQTLIEVRITANKLFSLEISRVKERTMAIKESN